MSYALIRESDGAWLAGPLDDEPAAGEGERAIEVALGLGETCEWSPARRAFVDIVVAQPMITVGRFKLLMTTAERIAIREASATDPVIFDFLDVLAGFAEVSVSDPVLVRCIQALVPKGLLTAERAEAVLAGIPAEELQ